MQCYCITGYSVCSICSSFTVESENNYTSFDVGPYCLKFIKLFRKELLIYMLKFCYCMAIAKIACKAHIILFQKQTKKLMQYKFQGKTNFERSMQISYYNIYFID